MCSDDSKILKSQFMVAHIKFDCGFHIHALRMVKAVMKGFTIVQKICNLHGHN